MKVDFFGASDSLRGQIVDAATGEVVGEVDTSKPQPPPIVRLIAAAIAAALKKKEPPCVS